MTDREAYTLIGERAAEIVKRPEVQQKMLEIAQNQGRKEAEKYLYMLAISTLTLTV